MSMGKPGGMRYKAPLQGDHVGDDVDIGEGSVVVISSGPLNTRGARVPDSWGERVGAQ